MKHTTYENSGLYSPSKLVACDRRPYDEYTDGKGKNLRWAAPSFDLELGLKKFYGHPMGKNHRAISPAEFTDRYRQELSKHTSRIRKHITPDTVIVGWSTDDGQMQTQVFCEFLDKMFRHG